MLNYIHSELYRTMHNKGFWGMMGVLAGLAVLIHVVLWLFAANAPEFPYGTSSYSYSLLVSTPMLFCVAAFLVVSVLYESDHKNGNDKNSIAFGISRTRIFAGKCIVSLIAGVVMMAVVLAAYIGANLLLVEQAGPVLLADLLEEVIAVFPASVSAMVLSVLLLSRFEKSSLAGLLAYVILFAVPKILLLMGTQLEPLMEVAMWMPANLFSLGMEVNLTQCVTIWGMAGGMLRCVQIGAAGIVLFGLLGVWTLRKRDIR